MVAQTSMEGGCFENPVPQRRGEVSIQSRKWGFAFDGLTTRPSSAKFLDLFLDGHVYHILLYYCNVYIYIFIYKQYTRYLYYTCVTPYTKYIVGM